VESVTGIQYRRPTVVILDRSGFRPMFLGRAVYVLGPVQRYNYRFKAKPFRGSRGAPCDVEVSSPRHGRTARLPRSMPDRLNVSQPPFSKQIHDLEGERGIEFFERQPSALAFVAAGFGVAAVSEPLRKIPAKHVVFRNLTPEDRAWVLVGVAWKPEAVSAPVVSKFVDVLAQVCAGRNGEIAPQPTIV
jgi:hypothetical protein